MKYAPILLLYFVMMSAQAQTLVVMDNHFGIPFG